MNISLEGLSKIMNAMGAKRILFKLLANNDNSKNQIYMGSDDILKIIPHSDMKAGKNSPTSRNGIGFKARVNITWIDPITKRSEPALGSQLILYPKYPEVRLSGFINGCSLAPSELMRPSTPEQRAERINIPRCLILGICEDERVLAYASPWDSSISHEAKARLNGVSSSLFHELVQPTRDSKTVLLGELKKIYDKGWIPSQKLDMYGNRIPYANSTNGAGVTLEAELGIRGNGRSEPDFLDWELKSHAKSPVTLMTPEPDQGLYVHDFEKFMMVHHSSKTEDKINFSGIHKPNIIQKRTNLRLVINGASYEDGIPVDPTGGVYLIDYKENIVAGWSFEKLISHWTRKHAKTAFINYTRCCFIDTNIYNYIFGPDVFLCSGNSIKKFLKCLASGDIYYDPGINIKKTDKGWKRKKRNQFRIKWNDITHLYSENEYVDLSSQSFYY